MSLCWLSGPWAPLGRPRAPLGLLWGSLGGSVSPRGRLFGVSLDHWVSLGRAWVPLGPRWGSLGTSLASLGGPVRPYEIN